MAPQTAPYATTKKNTNPPDSAESKGREQPQINIPGSPFFPLHSTPLGGWMERGVPGAYLWPFALWAQMMQYSPLMVWWNAVGELAVTQEMPRSTRAKEDA